MKLMTDKRYVLYYNYLTKYYGYDITYKVDESVKFWSSRFPIMYSNSLKVIQSTKSKLNEQIYD